MTKTYKFVEYDDDSDSKITVEFHTDDDCWSGYDGPMWKFFDFLKGCGYVFDINDEIGVMHESGNFSSASPEGSVVYAAMPIDEEE